MLKQTRVIRFPSFFFFNDTATTEIYTLSLHDALPIWGWHELSDRLQPGTTGRHRALFDKQEDRKSTRLNSSHANISYAVFCLKKKKKTIVLEHTCFFFIFSWSPIRCIGGTHVLILVSP